MRAVVWRGPREIDLAEIPDPNAPEVTGPRPAHEGLT
ncbi:hypothetical protein LN037_07045 [Actinomycetospora sp. SF1]|nr:hypothetical protein [Actinomycetospora soli]MCD2186911.1 hypothetical protein [Actinomycetospora soli]